MAMGQEQSSAEPIQVVFVRPEDADSQDLEQSLRRAGWEVEMLSSGWDLLDRLDAGLPDLLVLDMALQRELRESLRLLRLQPHLQRVPVALLVDDMSQISIMDVSRSTQRIFLKPVQPQQFGEVMRDTVPRAKRRQIDRRLPLA
jgi:DNA-binding response OmpR family regulator